LCNKIKRPRASSICELIIRAIVDLSTLLEAQDPSLQDETKINPNKAELDVNKHKQ
jgi:hypothetical protein